MLSISGSDTEIQNAPSRAADAEISVSVVVPVADESGNIVPQIEEIAAALGDSVPYEIVYVDDASTDATAAELAEARGRFPQLRVLTHARRCGQSAAITTGVLAAQAPVIATLDGDRQTTRRTSRRCCRNSGRQRRAAISGWSPDNARAAATVSCGACPRGWRTAFGRRS